MTKAKYWKFNVDPYIEYNNATVLSWYCGTHNEHVTVREDQAITGVKATREWGTWISNFPVCKYMTIRANQTCSSFENTDVRYKCKPINIQVLWRDFDINQSGLSIIQETWKYTGKDTINLTEDGKNSVKQNEYLFMYKTCKHNYKEIEDGIYIKNCDLKNSHYSFKDGEKYSHEDIINMGFVKV